MEGALFYSLLVSSVDIKHNIDGLKQEKRYFIALTMELRLSCINASISIKIYRQPVGHGHLAQMSLILSLGPACYRKIMFAPGICKSSSCNIQLTYLNISQIFESNVVAMREGLFLASSECNFGQTWAVIDRLVIS